jgi:hypothetical protein
LGFAIRLVLTVLLGILAKSVDDRLVNIGPLLLLVAVGGALNYSCVFSGLGLCHET